MLVKGKSFAVLGLGISGQEAAIFLAEKGARVFVSESQKTPDVLARAERLTDMGIDVEIGANHLDRLARADHIIVSPGISPHSALMKQLQSTRSKWMSEVALAASFFSGDIIAITGTSGKTTMTTLVERLLCATGRKAVKCGNIGLPFISIVGEKSPPQVAVVELSSFQLFYTQDFNARLAILLNLAPNHLDWHADMQEYLESKMRLFEGLGPGQMALFNGAMRPSLKKFLPEIQAGIHYFNEVGCDDPNEDCLRKVACLFGLDQHLADRVYREFEGIEHRMEKVRVWKGVTFINDSKSTTLFSLQWALKKFKDKSVILICGGKNKGLDFNELRDLVAKKAKLVLAIGQAAPEIKRAFWDLVSVKESVNLNEVVRMASLEAEPGETVLFSPACASFDMFRNYEDRGKQFKAVVAELLEE